MSGAWPFGSALAAFFLTLDCSRVKRLTAHAPPLSWEDLGSENLVSSRYIPAYIPRQSRCKLPLNQNSLIYLCETTLFQEHSRPVGVEAVQGEETLKDGMGASEAGRSPLFGIPHKTLISGC